MIYKNIKERQEHKIEILSNKIEELEKDIQQWISFNKDKEHQIYVLENELKEYRKLQSEVHTDIEKVWMYDTSIDYSEKNRSLAEKDSKERSKIIERVFYKIANQKKDEDGPYWCKHPDENGNKIPMTKVKGSRVMSKEEVEELNKIKLPF